MATKVKKAFLNGAVAWYFSKAGNVRLMSNVTLCVEIERKGRRYDFEMLFKKGYESDGLSRPDFIGGWIPRIDEKNSLYNFAGFAHDWLYSVRGVIDKEFILSRSECDDIFRGILRKAGVSRFKAGVMDFFVGLFAGGPKHWGNDSLGSRDKVVCSKVICADGR